MARRDFLRHLGIITAQPLTTNKIKPVMTEEIQLVKSKLQVWHFAQVPCNPFCVNVKDEYEAYKIAVTLARQHSFLYNQKIIPDYSNSIVVMMWDEDDKEWIEYFNDRYGTNWDEFEEMIVTYLEQAQQQTKPVNQG